MFVIYAASLVLLNVKEFPEQQSFCFVYYDEVNILSHLTVL